MKFFSQHTITGTRSRAIAVRWIVTLVLSGNCLLAQTITHGTIFAVERTSKIVALAIDSSSATLDVRNNADGRYSGMHPVCKIYSSAGAVFAIAGNVGFTARKKQDENRNFQANKIIGEILAQNPPSSRTLSIIESRLVPHYRWIINNSPVARTEWKDGSPILEVVVAGAENGVPFIHAIQLLVHIQGHTFRIISNKYNCPGDCPNSVGSLASRPPGLHVTGNPILDTETRLQKALASGNKDFLPPMQVISISGNGQFKWIEKPDFCSMIPAY